MRLLSSFSPELKNFFLVLLIIVAVFSVVAHKQQLLQVLTAHAEDGSGGIGGGGDTDGGGSTGSDSETGTPSASGGGRAAGNQFGIDVDLCNNNEHDIIDRYGTSGRPLCANGSEQTYTINCPSENTSCYTVYDPCPPTFTGSIACTTGGQVTVSNSWNQSNHLDTSGQPCGSVYYNITNSAGTLVGTRGPLGCNGSASQTFTASAGATYYATVVAPSGASFGQIQYTAPDCGGTPLAGTLNATGCSATTAGGTCGVVESWNSSGTVYTTGAYNGPLNIVDVVDNATGNYYTGTATVGVSYAVDYANSGGTTFALPQGSYTLRLWGYNMTTNPDNGWNLLSSKQVTVSDPTGRADLSAGAITPTTATAGVATVFSATVVNTGNASTGVGFNNLFQVATGFSNGTATGVSDIAIANTPTIAAASRSALAAAATAALSAATSRVVSATYTFSGSGTYYMRMCADKANAGDAAGVITESDETNNCGSWTGVSVTPAVSSCPAGQTLSSGLCCPTGQTNVGGVCRTTTLGCTVSGPCTSAPNSCGMTTSGTYDASCVCGAATPSNNLCPAAPILSLTANPSRVRSGNTTALTWTSGNATSCSLTSNPNVFSSSALSGTNVSSGAITSQTMFNLRCSNANGSSNASQTVFVLPSYIEQ